MPSRRPPSAAPAGGPGRRSARRGPRRGERDEWSPPASLRLERSLDLPCEAEDLRGPRPRLHGAAEPLVPEEVRKPREQVKVTPDRGRHEREKRPNWLAVESAEDDALFQVRERDDG